MTESKKLIHKKSGEIDFKQAVKDALVNRGDPNSHRELNPAVFHPSYLKALPECPRTAFKRKLGLEAKAATDQGVFQVGTLLHEWIEHEVQPRLPDRLEFEKPLTGTIDGIKVVGRCDCYDPATGIVYDFKSTGSTGYGGDDTRYPDGFIADEERHSDNADQLQIYMSMLDVDQAQLVYIHKLDMAVKRYPVDDVNRRKIQLDENRVSEIIDAAKKVRDKAEEFVVYNDVEERYNVMASRLKERGIPFDKCGRKKCWSCKYETLKDCLTE